MKTQLVMLHEKTETKYVCQIDVFINMTMCNKNKSKIHTFVMWPYCLLWWRLLNDDFFDVLVFGCLCCFVMLE